MLNLVLAVVFHSTVGFTLVDNRIVVSTTVNGQSGFAMIVDTGVTGIVLTPQAAAKLRLRTTKAPDVTGAGTGSAQTKNTHIENLRLGTYATGPKPALVVNLDHIRKTFGFPRLDGIVGFDMLGGRYVGIDMGRRRLTMSSTPLTVPRAAKTTPYDDSSGLLTIEAAINGARGHTIIDTGDRSSFTVFEPFARAHGFYKLPMSKRNVVTGIGAGGPIRGDVFQSTIDAFGFTSTNVTTRAPLGPAGIFSSSTWIGSIGDGLLRRFDLVFDGVAKTITAWPR